MDQLEKFFEELFLKKISYQLPANAREMIVKVAPWLTLIVLILTLPAIFAIFGFHSFYARIAYSIAGLGFRYYLSIAVLAIQVVIMGMSIPGLIQRVKKGWQLVYYSSLISAVHSILFSFSPGEVIWSLLGSAIGLYIIFQVKSYYK
jgi:hypothetical protein